MGILHLGAVLFSHFQNFFRSKTWNYSSAVETSMIFKIAKYLWIVWNNINALIVHLTYNFYEWFSDQSIHYIFTDMAEKDELVQRAKLAEQAERWIIFSFF